MSSGFFVVVVDNVDAVDDVVVDNVVSSDPTVLSDAAWLMAQTSTAANDNAR
jgi:hypothetical protein